MPRPETIMVIRHGEKPADGPHPPPPLGVDEQGKECDSSLTTRGWQRAGALALTLGVLNPKAPVSRPTALMSPDYGHLTAVHRTSETIRPLARRLGVEPTNPAAKGHEKHLIKHAVLQTPGTVLVCWEHHHIPDLMSALAAELDLTDLPPIAKLWPDDDFDSVIVVTVADPSVVSVLR